MYPTRISGTTSKNIIATPIEPINIAGHARMDTRSLNRKNPKMADATGKSDAMTKASASGRLLNPSMKKTDPKHPNTDRIAINHLKLVFKNPIPDFVNPKANETPVTMIPE